MSSMHAAPICQAYNPLAEQCNVGLHSAGATCKRVLNALLGKLLSHPAQPPKTLQPAWHWSLVGGERDNIASLSSGQTGTWAGRTKALTGLWLVSGPQSKALIEVVRGTSEAAFKPGHNPEPPSNWRTIPGITHSMVCSRMCRQRSGPTGSTVIREMKRPCTRQAGAGRWAGTLSGGAVVQVHAALRPPCAVSHPMLR